MRSPFAESGDVIWNGNSSESITKVYSWTYAKKDSKGIYNWMNTDKLERERFGNIIYTEKIVGKVKYEYPALFQFNMSKIMNFTFSAFPDYLGDKLTIVR